jgi:hypothetical protein
MWQAARSSVQRLRPGPHQLFNAQGQYQPGTEQRPAAPWLRHRKNENGKGEMRVVELERRVERLATPQEIEQGVF